MSVALVALAAGYLLGAVPTAHLVARSRGRSVFDVGSGSMGAMNVARNLGMGPGLLVLAIDVGKGALATYLGLLMMRIEGAGGDPLGTAALLPPLLAGAGAVTGHCFSAYVSFRGGQGLATALGAALPLYPYPALYAIVLIVALVLIFRRSEVAILITLGLYPVVTLLALERQGWPREATFLVTTVVVIMCLIGLVRQLANRRVRRRASRDLSPAGGPEGS
ncbi:MAG TPA: glycerol-3-phosphate acyltransferase [Trueperaceae bacterium]|nr:glycerol-3-phosphate acyltransferase [Trueperaceae bacterium]